MRVVLVDLDGTLCDMGDRGPYEEETCLEDMPVWDVLELMKNLNRAIYFITFISGRDEGRGKPGTVRWLDRYLPGFLHPDGSNLLMRPAGDTRPDEVVKRELVERSVLPYWDVAFVLDDRNKVVKMWREELGLTCLQVAEGDF